MQGDRDLDIARNIRLIEWLKSELITGVAEIYRFMLNGARASQEAVADALASIILACYLLGKRLGIHYAIVDQKMESKIRLGIVEEHEIEKDYGDLSSLGSYIKNNRG
jgi:hypothetical protein